MACFAIPVPAFSASTFALGTDEPDMSMTFPVREPYRVCALATLERASSAIIVNAIAVSNKARMRHLSFRVYNKPAWSSAKDWISTSQDRLILELCGCFL